MCPGNHSESIGLEALKISFNKYHHKILEVYMVIWFMYTLWKDSPCLINLHTHYLTYLYCFFFLCVCVYVRRVKFYFLSRFQLYNKVLSTIVTTIYIRSWDLIHRATESLYPFANLSSLFLPPCSPWQPLFYSLFLWVWLFKKIPHINDTM